MWDQEKLTTSNKNKPKFGLCCLQMSKLPECLMNLLTFGDQRSKLFRSRIRSYNSILSFTSVYANIDKELMSQTARVYTYRICGTVHHKIGDMLPKNNKKPGSSHFESCHTKNILSH